MVIKQLAMLGCHAGISPAPLAGLYRNFAR